MNRNQINQEGQAVIGCGTLILLLFMLPLIVSFLKVLAVILVIGGIGLGVYKLNQFYKNNEKFAETINTIFDFSSGSYDNQYLIEQRSEEDFLELPPPTTDETNLMMITKLEDIAKKLETLELAGLTQDEEINKRIKNEIGKSIDKVRLQIEKENKKSLLHEIFGEVKTDYSRSEEFEKMQFQEEVKKKREGLEIREIKQEMSEHLLAQDKQIFQFKTDVKDDLNKVWDGFQLVHEKFMLLEKDLLTLKGYVSEKFTQLEVMFTKEISNIKELITTIRFELKEEISDTKLQFGQEVLRLDRQQLQIVDRLEQYGNKMQAFSNEIAKVKIDAEKFSIRGEKMLNMATTIYQRHKAEISKASNEFGVALQQMAIHKEGFANKVGKAKLKMDEISNRQYLALKEIALEKVGVNALRENYQNKLALGEERIRNLNKEQRSLKQQIQTQQAFGLKIQSIQHQLHMSQERERYASNQNNIIRQESALVNRLSK